jgi:hypothetical protein
MPRCFLSYLVCSMALVVVGCGTGAETPAPKDAAAGTLKRGTAPLGEQHDAPPPINPARATSQPTTLAERLRAIKAAGDAAVWVEARYDDGSVYGSLQDREVKLGRRAVKLRQIRHLRGGPTPEVELSDGTRLAGQFADLRQLIVTIGETPHPLDLTHAVEVIFTTSYVEAQAPVVDTTVRGTGP